MAALRATLARLDLGPAGRPDRRELRLLAAAMALGLLVRVVYALAVNDRPLVGDQLSYDAMGRLAADGRWLWGVDPYGIPHPTFWKPPGYPVWVSAWYSVLGPHAHRLTALQALIGPVVIGLTWLLSRRLLGSPRAAIASAAVVAVYPNAWQYEELLYSEALAVPMTLVLLVAGLGRAPGWRRAAGVGALGGLALLVRPNAFVVLAALVAGWVALTGLRRGVAAGALAAVCAALVVAPWSIRNTILSGEFVPLSVQDGAISGTFNDDSATEPGFRYAWRPVPRRDVDILDPRHPLPEAELLHELRSRGLAYIRAHPESVPQAFFWNGLVRLWDLRPPSKAMHDIRFEGGMPGVALAGVLSFWVLAPLALAGVWRLRHRRDLLAAVITLAVLASLVCTIVSGTRYRAPLEPLVVVLACSLLASRPAAGGRAIAR